MADSFFRSSCVLEKVCKVEVYLSIVWDGLKTRPEWNMGIGYGNGGRVLGMRNDEIITISVMM